MSSSRPVRVALTCLLAVSASACVVAPESDSSLAEDEPVGSAEAAQLVDPDGGGSHNYLGLTINNVSISGHELFDDSRDYGRFALRETKAGVSGKNHTMDGTSNDANYLGLREAKVELFEVDNAYDTLELDCKPYDLLGSATVAADGSWSFSFSTLTDACGSDNDPANKVSLAVKTTLTYCDSNRCFSIVDPTTGASNATMAPWSLWHPSATLVSPKAVASNANVTLSDHYFEDTSTLRDAGDIRHEAALIFAGIVDTTRKLHVQASWPFFQTEHGPVYVQFPGTASTGNTSGGTTIEMLSGQLKNGWTAMHEYGHIIHQRVTSFASSAGGGGNDYCATNPSTGNCECGTDESATPGTSGYVLDTTSECSSWSRTGESEYKAKAWKEGFADFIAHITIDTVSSSDAPSTYLHGCSNTTYDVNLSAASTVTNGLNDGFGRRRIFGCGTSPGTCVDGARYPTNVARALCDWYDDNNDNDSERGGSGDVLSHSLDAMFTTMQDAYDDLGQTWVQNNGFTICDFATYHVDHEGGASSSHGDVLSNNGIGCNL